MLVYILVVLILFLIFIWLFMKVFATEEEVEQTGNVVGGKKCILMYTGNPCSVDNKSSRFL